MSPAPPDRSTLPDVPTGLGDPLAAVRRLAVLALSTDDAGAIHRALAEELLAVFGVDQVHVNLLSQDGRSWHGMVLLESAAGWAEQHLVTMQDGPSGIAHVVRTQRPLHVPDAPAAPVLSPALVERFGVASALFVPVIRASEVREIFTLVTRAPRAFNEREIELARTFAEQAAAALMVLEVDARRIAQAEQQTALARAAKALNARLDLRAVLETLCREASLAVGGDIAGVYLGDSERGGTAVAGHGIDEDWLGYEIKPGEGVGGQVLATGSTAIANAYQTDVQVPAHALLREVQTAVAVPVRWNGELRGALSVAFRERRWVTQEDIALVEAVAELAATACHNAESFERAQEAARTDSLTGLLNHGALQVRIRAEVERARRERCPLACMIVDLDDFKGVNDRHGHLVGDQILQAVANSLTTEFRPYDALARYGGDEFVLLLPGLEEAAATQAAERATAAIADVRRRMGEPGAPVSASIGVALWREPLSATDLLARADRALLLAKRRGRDGWAVASAETERELALLEERSGSPSGLTREFWDMVSASEHPRDWFTTLPFFLRRTMDLQEVALYEPTGGSGAAGLHRVTVAHPFGDPGRMAFVSRTLPGCPDLAARLEPGALSRSSLADLHRALALEPDEHTLLAPHGAYAAVALARGEKVAGLLLMRSSAPEFPLAVLNLAELVATQAMTVLLGQTGEGSPAAVAALAAAIDARDDYTHEHSEQVVALACEVAAALGLPPREIERVRDGAMLHDVGKVAIPNEILYKPGRLTGAEWEVMRQHPVIGERILRRTPALVDIAPLVRHEHEHWDGSGYPDGLAGREIPAGSRIILACDAYNAMITARPYRDPMSEQDARAELRRCAGQQFDPEVVAALLRVLAKRPGAHAAREPLAERSAA